MPPHEHWVKITVEGDTITLTDHLGNEKTVKGAMVVAHDEHGQTLYGLATGDPTEIARGFGEILARRGDDPYFLAVYRALLMELCIRTGVRPDHPAIITPEDALKMFEKDNGEKGKFH